MLMSLRTYFGAFLHTSSGATAVEYGLIASLVAIATVGSVHTSGVEAYRTLMKPACHMAGYTTKEDCLFYMRSQGLEVPV